MTGLRLTMKQRPRIVGKLRYLCRADKCGGNPEHERALKNAANLLLLTIESLGLGNQPDRWPGLRQYQNGAALIKKLTGEDWKGENA